MSPDGNRMSPAGHREDPAGHREAPAGHILSSAGNREAPAGHSSVAIWSWPRSLPPPLLRLLLLDLLRRLLSRSDAADAVDSAKLRVSSFMMMIFRKGDLSRARKKGPTIIMVWKGRPSDPSTRLRELSVGHYFWIKTIMKSYLLACRLSERVTGRIGKPPWVNPEAN